MIRNLFHRIVSVVLLSLGAASCGFTPAYAPNYKTASTLSDIMVASPGNDFVNYVFVRELEDRIGRNLNGSKLLEHSVWVYEQGLESEARRIQLIGKIDYKVISIETERVLHRGSVENFVSFVIDRDIETSVRRDARERLMSLLADQMVTRLITQLSFK